ncbi:sporulation protein YpjB [Paenibacillus sp. GCM10027626]|uniref:sporulation protein YpjB n=1 Tax=Paenibacillus sp. GCM10027626 TaxID=3273411 RepID=UPI00362B1A15
MRASILGLLLTVILITSAACSDASARVMAKQTNSLLQEKTKSGMKQLNTLADQLYMAANEGNRQVAFSAIVRLEKAAGDMLLRQTGQAAGWKSLEQSIAAAKKQLNKNLGKGAFMQAARVKLAVDALQQQSPLWLQYKTVLQDDLARARRLPAVNAITLVEMFQQHVERIEVAALMTRPPEQIEELQEQILNTKQVLRYAADDPAQSHLVGYALTVLEQSAMALFASPSAAGDDAAAVIAAPLPPNGEPIPARELLMTMFLASLVMGVLGFVGWRKFRQDELYSTSLPPSKPPRTRYF